VGVILTSEEKSIARTIFRLKIHESDGSAFERLFTDIMDYAEPDFKQIKPWGNIGDRKNDGYIRSKGIFYQVFAPEDIRFKCPDAVAKLKDDFSKLIAQWSPVNEFYFMINDKYKGVPPNAEVTMSQLIKDNNLANGGILTAKHLENTLFSLADDQILAIIKYIPDPSKTQLDFSVLNEVIQFIMKLPLNNAVPPDLEMPDWEKKIQFNRLSAATAIYLNNGYLQVIHLNQYLDSNSGFLADELRDRMNEIYNFERKTYSSDELFWTIVKRASPRDEFAFQSAVIVIMAKYFEACDIFERPEEVQDDSAN